MQQVKSSISVLFFLLLTVPAIGNKQIKITDFGAVPDGKTLNTEAIQQAIDETSKTGGGKIIFPEGIYLCGSIVLQSNVELHLEEGAVLLGSANPYDYKKIAGVKPVNSSIRDDKPTLAFIVAHEVNNISLSGKGTINGQGRELALAIDSLHHIGELVDPKYNYRRMRPHETARPKLFRFSKCNNIHISGLNIQDGACWGLSFELCSNLVLDHLTIFSRDYWNNDGMDITDCRNVRVTNCDVNSADDGICLKSYNPGYANDSIYIANCTVRSNASAIKFGTASYGGFKNVTIDNIKVFDTFRSAIAIESVDGGDIENIKVSNILAKNTGNAIFIRLGHRDGEQPGTIKNIHIKNVKVQVPFGRPDIDYDMRGPEVNFFHNPFPSPIAGIPGHKIENVILENIEISYPGRASKGMAYIPLSRLDQVPEKIKDYPEFSMFGELPAWGFYIRHAKGITMKNIRLSLENKDFRPAFVFDNVYGLKLNEIRILNDKKDKSIILKEVDRIHADQKLISKIRKLQ